MIWYWTKTLSVDSKLSISSLLGSSKLFFFQWQMRENSLYESFCGIQTLLYLFFEPWVIFKIVFEFQIRIVIFNEWLRVKSQFWKFFLQEEGVFTVARATRETDNLVVNRLHTTYTKLLFPLYSITNRSFFFAISYWTRSHVSNLTIFD